MNGEIRRVFIVDDAREVRTALSRVLTIAGYQVQSFESAERFLEEQDAETPGCLLLDICMPGLSGIDLQHSLMGSPGASPSTIRDCLQRSRKRFGATRSSVSKAQFEA
jgi:FixJ family two-component response regulator